MCWTDVTNLSSQMSSSTRQQADRRLREAAICVSHQTLPPCSLGIEYQQPSNSDMKCIRLHIHAHEIYYNRVCGEFVMQQRGLICFKLQDYWRWQKCPQSSSVVVCIDWMYPTCREDRREATGGVCIVWTHSVEQSAVCSTYDSGFSLNRSAN